MLLSNLHRCFAYWGSQVQAGPPVHSHQSGSGPMFAVCVVFFSIVVAQPLPLQSFVSIQWTVTLYGQSFTHELMKLFWKLGLVHRGWSVFLDFGRDAGELLPTVCCG